MVPRVFFLGFLNTLINFGPGFFINNIRIFSLNLISTLERHSHRVLFALSQNKIQLATKPYICVAFSKYSLFFKITHRFNTPLTRHCNEPCRQMCKKRKKSPSSERSYFPKFFVTFFPSLLTNL